MENKTCLELLESCSIVRKSENKTKNNHKCFIAYSACSKHVLFWRFRACLFHKQHSKSFIPARISFFCFISVFLRKFTFKNVLFYFRVFIENFILKHSKDCLFCHIIHPLPSGRVEIYFEIVIVDSTGRRET